MERKFQKEKLRVAVYGRFNNSKKNIQKDIDFLKEYYMEMFNQNHNWKLADFYIDIGVSGIDTEKKKELQRMMKDVELGKIDLIITKSVSKFSRNTSELLNCINSLKQHNVNIYFEDENLDISESLGGIEHEDRSIKKICK